MESMVSFFILLALFAVVKCRKDGKWLLLFALSTAFGVLAKAAMGLMSVFILVPYLFFDGDVRRNIRAWHVLAGTLIFSAVALPWYYLEYLHYGASYVEQFLGHETLGRLTMPIEGHVGSLLYYLNYMGFYNLSSWGFLAPLAIPFITYKALRPRTRDLALIALYILVILCIFTFGVQTKLWWYIFSLYLPLSYACVFLMKHLRGKLRYVGEAVVVLTVIFLVAYNFVFTPRNTELKEMAPAFRDHLSASDTLFVYGETFQTAYFYADVHVSVIADRDELLARLDMPGQFFLINVRKHSLEDVDRHMEVLRRAGDMVFLRTASTESAKTVPKNLTLLPSAFL
jgi:4-amino-4-deoxy-L-arabinose transferase-like glycosyltransferase